MSARIYLISSFIIDYKLNEIYFILEAMYSLMTGL